jgi:hypothetical protein
VPRTARVGPRDGDQDSLSWTVRRSFAPGPVDSPTSYEGAAGQPPAAPAIRAPWSAKPHRRRSGRARLRRGRAEEHASGGGQPGRGRSYAAAQKIRSPRRGGGRPGRGRVPRATARPPDSRPHPPARSSRSSSGPAGVACRARNAPSAPPARCQQAARPRVTLGRRRGSSACAGERQHERVGSSGVDGPPAVEARQPEQQQERRAECRAVAQPVALEPPAAARGAATAGRCSHSGRRSGARRGGRRARGLRARRSARSCRRLLPLRQQSPLQGRSTPGEPG